MAADRLSRRLRYRLSSLLLFVLAIVFGAVAQSVHRGAQQKRCVALLRNDGSRVYQDGRAAVVQSENVFGSTSHWILGNPDGDANEPYTFASLILGRSAFKRFTILELAKDGTLSLLEVNDCMSGMPWLEYMFVPQGTLTDDELSQLQTKYPNITFQRTDRNGRTPGLKWESNLSRF